MKLKVAVLYGGRSGEHEVSIRSAESIVAAMDPERYDIERFFIGKDGRWSPRPLVPEPGANGAIDVVFPVLHGTFGEDGTMQGLLELADLAYVGAGVLASAVSMDKEFTKRACRERGLPIVEYCSVARERIAAFVNPFGYPVFVKPANLGSSVGISKAKDAAGLRAALRTCLFLKRYRYFRLPSLFDYSQKKHRSDCRSGHCFVQSIKYRRLWF
jgi:D-alanine-D-alanine ligase